MGIGRAVMGIALIAAVTATACDRVDNDEHVAAVRALLDSRPAWVPKEGKNSVATRLWAIERDFYQQRNFTPVWIDGDRPTPALKELLQQLHASEAHGLDPAAYGGAQVEELMTSSKTNFRGTRLPADQVPDVDAKMTYAYLRYAADLLGWTSSPRAVDRNWRSGARKEDLAATLATALSGNSIAHSLEGLAPSHPQYKGLQVALAHEREQPTGHVELIRLNLERWRWAPRDLGDRYILVNVPSYQLQVMEGDTPALAMRVIVGKPDTPTPLFSDEMTYVVFSPTWSIPESIIRNETLPRVARDPDYLERNNIEVVRGRDVIDPAGVDWSDEGATGSLRFRQKPGPENALGLVKFIFPNNFDVYLHDTPSDRLFNQDRRSLSHGCIRVENPVALAKYVLGDQPEWTEARIRAAMTEEREQMARLKKPLPVHIGYWTAWVEPDGKTVTYTDDPYAIDVRHARVRGVDIGSVRAADAAGVTRPGTGASGD